MLIIVKNTLVEINIAWKKIKKRNKEIQEYDGICLFTEPEML